MRDVIAVGELLVDMFRDESIDGGDWRYVSQAGGAPANVLAALARLGRKTTLISKTGNDEFGRFLMEALLSAGVDGSGVIRDMGSNTMLAFVHLDRDGDRSFSFYRNPGADQLLEEREMDWSLIDSGSIVHAGSVSLTHEPSASATLAALRYARASGKTISFDPNLRPALWSSLEHARTMIYEALYYADVVKVSEEELKFLTGTDDPNQGSLQLLERFGTKVILVSLGGEGSYCRIGTCTCAVEAYPVNPVDTTGAGDTFLGAFLHMLLENDKPPEQWSLEEIQAALLFANAAAALVTTRKGALNSMPDSEEINRLMMSCQK
ncbi:carbohydrate kinase family protein [Paenibacillus luteus]|uniref:carbohydrate kinase family protein n=1 Tax=Paenibacillus luteus TaxID=2545753 RepID=UPI00114467D4|nr:carbohydrate kinase [Paenibacillus luteus]